MTVLVIILPSKKNVKSKKQKKKPFGFVYFIRDPNSKAIKIGVASNPESRLSQLNTGDVGHNLYIMKLIKTKEPFKLEKQLHHQFAKDRISPSGEWFRPSKELVKFVDSLPEINELKKIKRK